MERFCQDFNAKHYQTPSLVLFSDIVYMYTIYIPSKLCKTCLFETNLLLVLKIDLRIVRWLREIESCIAWNKQCFVMFNISAILNLCKYILFVDLVLTDK